MLWYYVHDIIKKKLPLLPINCITLEYDQFNKNTIPSVGKINSV